MSRSEQPLPIHRRITKSASRIKHIHAASVGRLDQRLSDKLSWYRRWHESKYHKYVHYGAVAVYSIGIGLLLSLSHFAHASGGSWTQSDWSGGVGSSTTNQYSAGTNVVTATANHITLATTSNLFTNSNYPTDLSGWNTGMAPNLITGLQIWLKADSIAQSNGTTVNTWNDSSGNGNNASAVNAGTLNTTGINGFPAVTLNGSNNYYTISPSTTIAMNNMTAFAVQKPGSNTTYGMLMSSSGADDEEFDINYPSNGLIGTYLGKNVGSGYSFTVGTPLISSFVSSASTTVYGNGTSQGSATPDSTHPASFHIGNYAAGSGYYYNGSTSEIIVYNTALTSSQRAAVEDYLSSKYGIAVSSGVAASRNTSTTYNATASAKLVAADAGEFSQNITTGSGKYLLSGYAYTTGAAVTSSDAQLYYNGSALTTTYTSVGGGWYDLSAVVTGTGGSVPVGVQVQSGKTVYLDGMTLTNYQSSATLTSNIYDTGVAENYGNLTYTVTTPAGTTASVKVRAGNQANLSDASAFTSCSAVGSGSDITSSCAPDKSRYVQYQVALSTSDGSVTPDFQSVTIAYTAADITAPPTNASGLAMYRSNGGASVASNGWDNQNPYFTWTAGADDAGGSGIAGYCLYLGQDPTGNPVTTKGDLGTSPLNTGGACQFAVTSTSIDTSTSGYIGSALTSSSSPYYFNVKAIDNAGNVYAGSADQYQFKYDNVGPTNPSFISAPSEFVSSKQVTLTWPTTGGDAASDDNSGLAGLQYRIGASGTWYGTNHNGAQDASDLLTNSGSYTTISSPDFSNLVEGNNLVYFRTWDNAGNVSAANVTTVIKINTSSPSSPQNVAATPSTNTTNSFGFSWLAPATYTGSAANITYCYTVNVLPSSSNCTYTAAGQTSLDAGAYATEPGDNTFYVVAKDEAGNINYATAANTTFTANTPAPGIPMNVDIADISVKTTNNWKLALSWEAPTNVGSGVSTYKVFRSTNGTSYTDIASTAGTSYVDSNLSQVLYYYKVQACDSANNCGGFTSVVSFLPTGKFTSPANLISGPTASSSTRTASVTWTTDRASDSSIEYGLSSGNYFNNDVSNSNQVTSHTVTLDNLAAGTTYYYRAQWTDVDGNIGTSGEQTFTTLPSPTVSNVTVSNINLHSAIIQFTSNNATAVKLYYGLGGVFSGTQVVNTSTSSSSYTISINGLTDGSNYVFKLDPFDVDKNEYQSTESHVLTTPPQPQITNVQFQPVTGALTGTEQMTWTTNVPATSEITYGLVGGATQNQLDTALVTSHSMTIDNLAYSSQYSVVATSIDALGNTATSDAQIFKSGTDTRPPKISDLTAQPSIVGNGAGAKGQLVVSWKTDKAGTSQVAYGQGSSGDYSTKTAEDASLVTNHVVVVSGLATSEVYHLQVVSNDAEGVRGTSGDQTTIIGQASDNALSIVFNALQSIFGL